MYSDIPMLCAEDKIRDISGITVKPMTGMRGRDCGIHWHNYYTIDIVTSGSGEHYLNGTVYPIKRGDAYLVRPTDIHSVDGNNLRFHSIRFIDRAIPEQYRSIVLNTHSTIQLDENHLQRIGVHVDSIAEYNTILAHSPDHALAADAISMHFSLILILMSGHSLSPSHTEEDSITKVMHWLDMHFRENPSIEDVSTIVNLSPSYFSTWFQKHTGRSYTEHMNSLRICYACSLLQNAFSVTDSCYASGFGSLSHFNHTFKKQVGISPGEYRQQYLHN